MAKGIIYLMSTAVQGLIKIGKTQTSQYETRMRYLESNGYFNVVGLKREFAIEVDDYDEKETLLHDIFERSQVSNSELFSVNLGMVKQLLASFSGIIVYPKSTSAEAEFNKAENEVSSTFFINGKSRKSDKEFSGTLIISNEKFILKKESIIADVSEKYLDSGWAKAERQMKIDGKGILQEDCEISSPSAAASIVTGRNADGKREWKNASGKTLGEYLEKKED